MRRLSTSTEEKRRVQLRTLGFWRRPKSCNIDKLHFHPKSVVARTKGYGKLLFCLGREAEGRALGLGCFSLEGLGGSREQGAGARRRTWLEAFGDLGLVLPASAAQGAMGAMWGNGAKTQRFLGPTTHMF